jgi:LysM repeat protein
MRRVYRLSENELIGVVKNSINEIEQERTNKVFNKIINDIDMTRGVHLRNMKKMTASKKETYLNNVMENYILDFFPRNSFIQESFDKKFTYNILFESPNRSYRKLFEFFDFFKRAVLLECGVLTERRFKNLVTELDVLGAVGDVVNKGVQMGKDVVNKGVEIGKKVVKAATPYMIKFLESEFARFVPGVNVLKSGYDVYKIYQNWEKIKKMTFEEWVEAFRGFVNGVTGVAIQIVLALTGAGNIANWIVNGLLLIYDVCYQGIGKGNWNLYNIITSAIALVGTGVAAAAFRPLKPLLGGIKRAIDIAPALAGGPTLTTVLPYIKLLGQNMGKLTGWVSKTFTLFTTKFPIIGKFLKPLQGGLTKIKIFLNDIVKGFKKYFNPIKPGETVKYGGVGKSTLQNAPTPKNIRLARTGGAHFDTTSIAKKLLATGDKTLTKKVVGKITKLYYTIKAGDTLQKIVSKFKPQGVTADILKQLNFEHGLEVKPGHKIRVA